MGVSFDTIIMVIDGRKGIDITVDGFTYCRHFVQFLVVYTQQYL